MFSGHCAGYFFSFCFSCCLYPHSHPNTLSMHCPRMLRCRSTELELPEELKVKAGRLSPCWRPCLHFSFFYFFFISLFYLGLFPSRQYIFLCQFSTGLLNWERGRGFLVVGCVYVWGVVFSMLGTFIYVYKNNITLERIYVYWWFGPRNLKISITVVVSFYVCCWVPRKLDTFII